MMYMRTRTTKSTRHMLRRRSSGWALVAVMTISVFSAMILFMLAGLTASLLNSDSFFRQRSLALNGAEAGLDYARKLMNESFDSGTPSIIEPAKGELERVTELPSQYVPQIGDNCRVMIRVKRLTDDNLDEILEKNSMFLRDSYAPSSTRNKLWKFGDDWAPYMVPDPADAPNGSYHWVVEVTSYNGVFASSIRAMLKPRFSGVGKPGFPFFPQGIVANGNVDIGSGFGYMDVASTGEGWSSDQVNTGNPGDPSEFKATIQTNGVATLRPGTLVYGNVRVTNPSDAQVSVANGDSNAIVLGRVQINATDAGQSVSGLQATAGQFPAASDNVLALGDLWANLPNNSGDFWAGEGRIGINQSTPMEFQASGQNQVTPNNVPSGQNTASLPTFPVQPPDGSEFTPSDVSVPSGDYSTGSLDSSNAVSKLVLNENGPGNTTRIFIDPNTLSSDAVNISTKFLVNNGDAVDLQIYYAGDKPLKIYLDADGDAGNPNLKAVIFAPNASVTTDGNGEFRGSIVAKNLRIGHVGAMQLDPNASQIGTSSSPEDDGDSNSPSLHPKVSGYKVETWQQINGSLVPLAN